MFIKNHYILNIYSYLYPNPNPNPNPNHKSRYQNFQYKRAISSTFKPSNVILFWVYLNLGIFGIVRILANARILTRTMVELTVEFLGGLDAIFNKQRLYKISSNEIITIKDLLKYIIKNLLTSKNDINIFIENETIRPGILTLINDTDWELEGELEYKIENDDIISFTSTLHGG